MSIVKINTRNLNITGRKKQLPTYNNFSQANFQTRDRTLNSIKTKMRSSNIETLFF